MDFDNTALRSAWSKNRVLSRAISRAVNTDYDPACYKVEKDVIDLHDRGNMLIRKRDGNVQSLVGLLQLCSDERATMLRSTAFVAYPVYFALFNVVTKISQPMRDKFCPI